MSLRELIALGTASQVPTRQRNHNAYLLRWDGHGFLFDPGEGTQRQFIFANVSVSAVTRIFISHFHGDHCLGLAGIVQRLSLDKVPHPVEVYYPQSGQVYFDRLTRASIFVNNVELHPRPVPDAGGLVCDDGQFEITALPLDHPVPTVGYRIKEPDGRRFLPEKLAEAGIAGPAVGQLSREGLLELKGRTVRLEDVTEARPGAVFSFVMDTRDTPNAVELARAADMLLIEATFLETERDLARNFGHLTAREAAQIAAKAGVRELVLGHFSQRYGNIKAHRDEARAVFPKVRALRDLDRASFYRP